MANGRSKFNPFRFRKTIGPGPKGMTNTEAKRWNCRCEQTTKDESSCICDAIRTAQGKLSRARKRFKINLRKKRLYAAMYRRWLKAQRG